VGSSNSMILGCMLSARAIATRCCCPPESCAGYLSAFSLSPTRSRYVRADAVASALGTPQTIVGASATFSSTVLWGYRLNCWKTIATDCRTLATGALCAVRSTPSTMTWPELGFSSMLMQRMSVDLPEPDGPMMTSF